MDSVDALNAIADLLNATEWDAQTLDDIADIMREAGYEIADEAPGED